MEENGEEKLLAVARHIAKTLGHNESMADDILQIFSNFDGRFSRDKLSPTAGPSAVGDDLRALDQSLQSLERQISQYVVADHPIWFDSADSSAFLDSVDLLISTIRNWTPLANSDKSVGACLSRAEDFLQQAMFRLGDEFKLLMEKGCESFEVNNFNDESTMFDYDEEDEEEAGIGNGDGDNHHSQVPVAQPLTDYHVVIDALPSGTIKDLHEIAKRMVAAGFGKECSHVYSSCRREFLEESMSRLGVQKLSKEEVLKMQWHDLEEEIDKWIKASNVALKILFPSERRLCDRVFFGYSAAADLSFMEVCRGSTIQILNFVDAVAIGSRSPERLFKILDLFECFRDLLPEFEANFSDQYCVLLRNDAVAICKRLGESIRGIFMELEHLIQRDPAKAPVPRGGLHPITRYVMNYVRAACRSKATLEQIFDENVNVVPSKDTLSSSLSVQMDYIMELLERNLDIKSKIYPDPALCSVFMMNNERYIVQKVRDSELGSLLGDDWIRKHLAKIKQYHLSYQRSSWNKILGLLKFDVGTALPNGKSLSMKEKIKMFNSHFAEICKTQSQWIIFDEQLREDMKVSLGKLLLPIYQSFIKKFQNSPEVGKNPDNYIKYRVEDIEMHINELFQGGNESSGSRK